jgi:hypothetical protein
MRRTGWSIVLSTIITAASGSENAIAAPRQQPTRICGGTTSPPHEIHAHEVFHERFLRVALDHFPALELQPSGPRGPVPAGRPPFAMEEMEWRQGNRHAEIRYWRLASVEDATTRLCWHRDVVNLPSRLVKGFADEAYEPYTSGNGGNGHVFYRRGVFFFTVSVDLESEVSNRVDVAVPRVTVNPAIAIARLFLAATDAVLAAEPAATK